MVSLSPSARLNDAVGQVPARAGANPLGGLVRQFVRRDVTLMSIIGADPICDHKKQIEDKIHCLLYLYKSDIRIVRKASKMDTDDLTPMANETLNLAYEAIDVLRSEIGASAIQYETEEEFLKGSLEHVEYILSDPKEYLYSWNYLDKVNIKEFIEGVKKVQEHIQETLNTPISERGKPPFE